MGSMATRPVDHRPREVLSKPWSRFVPMFDIKVMADITAEIWPVSSRQIAEKITRQIWTRISSHLDL